MQRQTRANACAFSLPSVPVGRKMAGRMAVLRLGLLVVLLVIMTSLPYVNGVSLNGFTSEVYRKAERADIDAYVPLTIGLHMENFAEMERQLWEISEPTNAKYGQYLAQEEVYHLSRPVEGAVDAIREWIRPFIAQEDDQDDRELSTLSSSGTFFPGSNMFKVSIQVRKLEELLSIELHEFQHLYHPHKRILRASQESTIPEHLEPFVAFVSVTTHPFRLRTLGATTELSQQAGAGEQASLEGGTLAIIRQTYNIPDDLVVTNDQNTQAISSFYTESWNPSDLEKFYKEFLPGTSLPNIIEKGDRKNNAAVGGTEASLDIQYITGVARNATTYVFTMAGSNPYSSEDEPFVEFAQQVLDLENPPFVVSISYSDDEENIFHRSAEYARSLDSLLIQMGLRGITVLVASGDDGAAGLRPEFEKIPVADICKKGGPQWPSSSPYITTVGATMQLSAQDFSKPFFKTEDEVPCSSEIGGIITTGGGFSDIYPMPEYQRKTVERYLQSRHIPKSHGFFNASGRAYPDIAALGASYIVYKSGGRSAVSGTSASTPTVAAMVTLWNDIRLNAGKSTLGFLNPLLYYLADANPLAFNDIVVGNNGASRGGRTVCDDSFGATIGWDAITGVGTPNFPVIADFIRGLEDHFNVSSIELDYASAAAELDASADNDMDATEQTNSDDEANATQSILGTVLLILSLVAAAVIGSMLVLQMYKKWRNQYASLNLNTPGERDDKKSPRDTRVTRTTMEDEQEQDEAENAPDLEMSEISLHD